MQRRLPPLNSLRAFEAAARLGSFSQAANELHVTHGAVSRHIQLLEEWLGTPMFRRLNRRVALTEAGSAYLSEVGAAFDRIALATAQHLERQRGGLLRVDATTTLTLRWLIPRLSGFQLANPGIEVRLTTSNETGAPLGGELDVILRQASGDIPGCIVAWTLPLYRIPVCNPELLAKMPIASLQDLREHTLLHAASRPTVWADWLKAAGVPELTPKHSLVLEHHYQTLQGALDGLGIACGSSALIADDVAEGRLTLPFAGPRLATEGYRAYVPAGKAEDANVIAFLAWLQSISEEKGDHRRLRTGPDYKF
jgi:LysR family transcriptional regulator, glycine cleavage system transcriptional activator